ncbi:hypothetical protein [Nitratireductor sp. StC3]|uniref:hypothetical protein n=1 Tax=Nitratireductor sp. StC3 TaxID=2126741 RepID=UPI000D0E138D|nr:hypothetical protein [Nitratireductor sp. StC3]PSM16970.1 hypothetical protein C7T96_18065 [Nitratireductor sp. StC3]
MVGEDKQQPRGDRSGTETALRDSVNPSQEQDSPFNGDPHAAHPHDPFRDLFGDSRQTFEF